jgi:hypothetical protein
MNLDADELAELRADFAENVYSDTMDIIQPAGRNVSDRGNAPTGSTVFLSDVPCRVGTNRQAANEGEAAGRLRSQTKSPIYVPFDTTRPTAGMWVVITSQNDRRGEIVGVKEVSGMLGLLIEVIFIE